MGYVDFSKVEVFILDEADRMLDMGFSEDIMRIVSELPKERQTLMFSATMPANIQKLARTILTEPKEVKIAVSKPAEKVDQSVYICHDYQKENLLKHIFEQGFNKRVIVFASSKLKVRQLSQEMRRSKWKTAEMHSDLDQGQREQVMHDFRAGRIDILIATDILSRGIDIDDIAMVVNYDVPHEAEDYVHRVGRTARANSDGKAVTFVSERDRRRWEAIEKFLDIRIRREEIPAEYGEAQKESDIPAQQRRKKFNKNRSGRKTDKNKANKSNTAPAEDSKTPVPEKKKRPNRRWRGHKEKSKPKKSPETNA